MPKISISYRRADSEAMTGRIFDRLASYYGQDAIFRDIDNIPPGIDFRVHINEMLRKTNILLAVIGPNWLGAASGAPDRIQQESDAVRVEIETALRRRTPLIPILIGTTTMPNSEQLPPSLKDFAFRNAVRVDTGQDFDYHMDRLIRSMDAILGQPQKSPPSGETRMPGGVKPTPARGRRLSIRRKSGIPARARRCWTRPAPRPASRARNAPRSRCLSRRSRPKLFGRRTVRAKWSGLALPAPRSSFSLPSCSASSCAVPAAIRIACSRLPDMPGR